MKQAPDEAAKTGLSLLGLTRLVAQDAQGTFAKTIALVLLAAITEGISIGLLVPLLTLFGRDAAAIDLVLRDGPLEPVFGPSLSFGLPAIFLALIAIVSLRAVLVCWGDIVSAHMVQNFTRNLRLSLFQSVAAADWSFLSTRRSADLNHSLTADVDRIQTSLWMWLALIRAAAATVMYLIVSLAISPTLTVAALAAGVVMLVAMRPLRRRARMYGDSVTQRRQEQYRVVGRFLEGMKASKAFAAEALYVDALARTLDGMRETMLGYVRLNSSATMTAQIASVIALAGFSYLALVPLQQSAAETATMLILYFRLFPRALLMQTSAQELNASLSALETVLETKRLCDERKEPDDERRSGAAPLERGIDFRNAGFRYPDQQRDALSNATLHIPARKITAIIGPTGSGKSTLADLMMGLLAPRQGEILIDGAPLTADNARAWRARISYVPQAPMLIHDTVRANLLLANPSASGDEIDAALEKANAAAFVRRLPADLDTLVGDRGHFLSGGEQQRLALARALLRRPSLLVLDEATSALDWEHEAAMADCIKSLAKELAVVAIAHRPAIIAIADHIVVLDNGDVAEQGAPQELLARSDSYLKRLMRDAGSERTVLAETELR